VFDWLKRRRLSEDTRRRLLVSLAKAEEAVVDTHVRNVLDVVAAVGGELPLDRVLELYVDAMDVGNGRSEIIARRVLSRLEGSEDDEEDGDFLTRRRR
jgi:hypothetical protein